MKKTLFGITLLLTVITVLETSCKKKETETTPTPTTPATPAANVLCDGNGTTSYYTLKLNNTWTYSYTSGSFGSGQPKITVTSSATPNSHTYFGITDATIYMYTGTVYFREDSTSHNIYIYDGTITGGEYIHVPATPVLNQSWAYYSSSTRKATNLSASITTSSCSYTGLLEISEYTPTGTLKTKEWYKKGVGMVYSEVYSAFGTGKYTLLSLTLQ